MPSLFTRDRRRALFISIFVGLVISTGSAQSPTWKQATPLNDLPNPYRRDPNWARLPSGMKWGAVIGAEPGPDGSVYVVHRCFENSCAGRPEAPIFKFDASGQMIRSWGAGEYVFPHGLYVDSHGNVWVTDQQAKDGKGNRVVEYDANGTVMMTIAGGQV